MNPMTRREARTRGRTRNRAKKVGAVVATGAIAASGLALGVLPASAATAGVGWGDFYDDYTVYEGSFKVGNNYVFCVQPGLDTPTGATDSGTLTTSIPGLTAQEMAGINKLISLYGDTQNKNSAAAMSYAIKYSVDPEKTLDGYYNYNDQYGHTLAGVIRWDLYSKAGMDNVNDIAAKAQSYLNIINNTPIGSGSTGSGDLVFTVDGGNNYKGTVEMDGTAGSTGTITLTNGVFADTGEATKTNAEEGVAYNVVGVPPDNGDPYKISGTGEFTAPGTSGYAANLTVYKTSGQQTAVGAGTKATNEPFTVEGMDPTNRSTTFQPVVATTAETYVQPGEKFTDTLTFGTQADGDGVNNDWFQARNGAYAPVTATGTVYGPFPDQPEESAEVPEDAPVAGEATVTTSTEDGPTVEYTATSDTTADEGGYYTWVWNIAYDAQDDGTKRTLPEGYTFQDKFGQVVESHVVPSDITAVSQITEAEIPLSGESNDQITVDSDGYWVKVDGKQIPVVFRGTAYYVPGDEAPKQQDMPDVDVPDYVPGSTQLTSSTTGEPAAEGDGSAEGDAPAEETGPGGLPVGTVELGHVLQTVNEKGTYTPEEGITIPASGEGYITWVWEIRASDQPEETRNMVRPWTDDFGVPAETQKILQPEVSTKAQAGVKPGEEYSDTAIVDGTLPTTGAEVSFEAFEVPMKQTEDGKWVVDAPEGAEPGDLSWVCTPENLVFSNVGDGEKITKPGEYESPKVKADEDGGKYLWVESLHSVPGEGAEPELIAQGECGLPNETTFGVDVTTQAQTEDGTDEAPSGTEIWDTAELTGYVPEGGTIEFQAYRNQNGQDAVCTADTLEWTSPAVKLDGGFYDEENPLEITGEAYAPEASQYSTHVYWIEVTKDAEGRVVSRGECGNPDETTAVAAAVSAVAATGGSVAGGIAAGAGIVALLGLGGFYLVVRRRKTHGTPEATE